MNRFHTLKTTSLTRDGWKFIDELSRNFSLLRTVIR